MRFFIGLIIALFFSSALAQTAATPPTSIVSATVQWHLMQKDGTMNVREVFTDDQGGQYFMDFQANVGASAVGRLNSDKSTMATALGLTVGGR